LTTRILREFTYLEPKTVQEATSMLSQYNGEAKPLAGGTDLFIYMKTRQLKPKYIVNVKKIPEFRGLRSESDGLHIGAATTIRALERSDLIAKQYPLLTDVISSFGSVQIRNMATIGGNICNASPGADFAAPLLALGTQLSIVAPSGERKMPLEEFFTGPNLSNLQTDELLVELILPVPKTGTGSAFIKLRRVSMDLCKVNVAAVLTVKGGVCEEVSIAMGAVAPTPVRAKNAEAMLKGKPLTNQTIESAASAASVESKPRTSLRSTAEYKREVVRALVKRCLNLALERGGG